ncbi:MAG: large ribosomal subunit protein bL28 [Candidatus Roizmanbacteria bacterium]
MSNVCYHCEKGAMYGRTHTHRKGVAGGRWRKRAQKVARIFKPNLQPMTIMEDKKEMQVRLCSSCIKRVKKDLSDGVRPKIVIKYHMIADQKPLVPSL